MQVKIDASALKKTRWYEFGVRFLFGGLITAGTGMIAKEFGPGVGGLFLAFPAIFPAGATLIEKHEKQKKGRAGLHGAARGKKAAAIDAAGASIGSIGLFVFALIVQRYLASHGPWLVLIGATVIWLAVSLLLWQLRKRIRRRVDP